MNPLNSRKIKKTKELQYSILMRNGNASVLVNTDFDNYADYMEEWEKKLLNIWDAGNKGSKTNTRGGIHGARCRKPDKQTTIGNEGSIENANANENKEGTVEKEGAALVKASKNTATTREKKGTRSKKASLPHDNSLYELLECTNEEEDKPECIYRVMTS
jgi:hypothetical protein